MTIYRRVLPPAFLAAARVRNVDVGDYLPPAPNAKGVWVGQTAAQHAEAKSLAALLEKAYNHPVFTRTLKILNEPPRQAVERSIEVSND